MSSIPTYNADGLGSNAPFEPVYLDASGSQVSQSLPDDNSPNLQSAMIPNAPGDFTLGQTAEPSYNVPHAVPTTWSMGPSFLPWLYADADPSVGVSANVGVDPMDVNMDIDGEVDWYNWIESAKGMEWDGAPNGNGRT